MAYLTRYSRPWQQAASWGFLAIAVLAYGGYWFWQPVAKVNPTHWENKAIVYLTSDPVQSLWLYRRHAAKLNLAQTYLAYADGKAIAIRLNAISYPTLYPNAVRVDFQPLNRADIAFILSQQSVLLMPQTHSFCC